jgi:3-hydroxy-9,10-secoandrosta-1,3,5(10)-triene-9,17-dione monooxygenase reductase component
MSASAPAAAVTAEAFRRFTGGWPTGVAVIGMLDGAAECGMTANSLVSVSLSPLMISLSVCLTSRAAQLLVPSAGFAVSVLGQGQEPAAAWFAGQDRVRADGGEFAGFPRGRAPRSAAPYLRDAVGFLDCVVVSRVAAGDHALLIGAVEYLESLSGRASLVFYRGGWSALAATTSS